MRLSVGLVALMFVATPVAHAGLTATVSLWPDGADADVGPGRSAISADGRYVAFPAFSRLDPADTLGSSGVYLHDRVTGTNERLSIRPAVPTPGVGDRTDGQAGACGVLTFTPAQCTTSAADPVRLTCRAT